MSSDSANYDPYRSPSMPDAPYVPPSGTQRPGMLTAVCVICIVLGVLGVMNGLAGLVAIGMGSRVQEILSPKGPQPGVPKEMAELQKKMQDDSAEVQKKYFSVQLVMTIARLIVAVLLIWGGIQGMGMTPGGRNAIVIALGAAIAFELGAGLVLAIVSMETMKLINEFIDGLSNLPQQKNGPPPAFLGNIVRTFSYIGFGLAFALLLAKVLFYFLGFLYVRKLPAPQPQVG